MDEADLYERAGRLFDELVELGAEERAAFLARAEATDPAAAALARKLIQRDRRGTVLDLPEGPDEDDPAGVLGATVGPYAIEELIGRGGMGAVYRARRREPDARVAIKFVTLAAAPAAAVARFEREVRLLASVDHPGIVRYRDSGVDRRGRPYLVMDHVAGEPVSHRVAGIAESVERTVAILVDVAEAVHYLHQRQILHRDLKPSNILLRRQGEALQPVIIDFGIARVLTAEGEPSATGTLGFGPVGTPAFMSPEQSRGDARPDVRTDVHALGAVLYALLTGHPPRDLDQLSSGDPVAFHARLRGTEARPPGVVLAADGNRRRARQIDRDLDAIVLKALALDPDHRYGSAEAFAADLLRWLGRLPVTARLVGPLGRLARLARRRPLETFLVAASLVLLVGTVVLTTISRGREVRARKRYEEQLAVTETVNRFFTDEVFGGALPEREGPDTPVIDVLRGSAEHVARLGDRPALAVALHGSLLGIFERLGARAEAEEQLALGTPLAARLPADHPERVRFDFQHGTLLTRRNRYAEAEPVLRGVLARLAEKPGSQPEVETFAANALGVVLLSMNRLEEAEPRLRQALEGMRTDDPRRFEAANNLALLRWSRGERDEAIASLERLIEESETSFGATHPYVLGLHANLASFHLDRLDAAAALPHARRAVELGEEFFEATHPDRLTAQSLLASCLGYEGRYDEAIELRLLVCAGSLERYGPENPAVAETLINLASILVRAGRAGEAVDPAWEALAIMRRTLGDGHPTTAAGCIAVAAVEDANGRPQDAIDLVDEAIRIYEAAEGDHGPALGAAREQRRELAARQAAR